MDTKKLAHLVWGALWYSDEDPNDPVFDEATRNYLIDVRNAFNLLVEKAEAYDRIVGL